MGIKDNYKMYLDRINKCYPCDKSKAKITGLFCDVCGCNMKIKARLPSKECPLGKWKKQE